MQTLKILTNLCMATGDNMKITRRQIRRIIREAIDPNADQEEAAYAIIYAKAYVSTFANYLPTYGQL